MIATSGSTMSDETAALLREIPGGRALLAWFNRPPDFGDAEVIGLHLDRRGPSTLQVETKGPEDNVVATFTLGAWIDVSLRGFGHQNVIGGLVLRRAGERVAADFETGVGLEPGDIEMELMPCFGAHGTIRANVTGVIFQKSRTV